jgi:aconitate hydratase
VKANYLASPPLVVAYAIAGRVDIDLQNEPLGVGSDGKAVYLRDIWPSNEEIMATVRSAQTPAQFAEQYAAVFEGDAAWRGIQIPTGKIYQWDDASTYIKRPPYFDALADPEAPVADLPDCARWPCWAIRSPRTTFRPPATSPRTHLREST